MTTFLINPADIVSLNVPNYAHGAATEGAGRWLHLSGQVGVRPERLVPHPRSLVANRDADLRHAAVQSEGLKVERGARRARDRRAVQEPLGRQGRSARRHRRNEENIRVRVRDARVRRVVDRLGWEPCTSQG